MFWKRKKTVEAISELRQLTNANTLHLRDILSERSSTHAGRNTYEVYGYPERYYFRLGYEQIRRDGIANRVAVGVPYSCWRNGFKLTSGDEEAPALDAEIAALNEKQLFSRMERADVLNRIGQFSVLLVGVPDGQELIEPVGRVLGDGYESIYFRPFAYDGVTVSSYDTDETSERFGMPEIYQLQVMGRGDTEKTQVLTSVMAHWTRVVHLAENLLDSDVEGIPALEPIYNRILDLDKVLGGSAEAYFRNARGKIAFEVEPEFSTGLINDPAAKEAFDAAARKFTDGWQDQIVAVGSKVAGIDTPHDSPIDTAKSILWEISGYTGIPLRILTGEGAGQLAGSEDRLTYNALVNDRQTSVCSMWVTRLLEILDMAGMLTLPESFEIDWPLDDPLNAIDEAGVALTQAQTLKTLSEAASTSGGDGINLDSALEHFGLSDIEVEDFVEPPDPVLPVAPGPGGMEDDGE